MTTSPDYTPRSYSSKVWAWINDALVAANGSPWTTSTKTHARQMGQRVPARSVSWRNAQRRSLASHQSKLKRGARLCGNTARSGERQRKVKRTHGNTGRRTLTVNRTESDASLAPQLVTRCVVDLPHPRLVRVAGQKVRCTHITTMVTTKPTNSMLCGCASNATGRNTDHDE